MLALLSWAWSNFWASRAPEASCSTKPETAAHHARWATCQAGLVHRPRADGICDDWFAKLFIEVASGALPDIEPFLSKRPLGASGCGGEAHALILPPVLADITPSPSRNPACGDFATGNAGGAPCLPPRLEALTVWWCSSALPAFGDAGGGETLGHEGFSSTRKRGLASRPAER